MASTCSFLDKLSVETRLLLYQEVFGPAQHVRLADSRTPAIGSYVGHNEHNVLRRARWERISMPKNEHAQGEISTKTGTLGDFI